MKQPVKKILSVMFVGCMLTSAGIIYASAVSSITTNFDMPHLLHHDYAVSRFVPDIPNAPTQISLFDDFAGVSPDDYQNVFVPDVPDAPIQITTIWNEEDDPITPFSSEDILPIDNVNYKGKRAYVNSFTCKKAYGNALNIWLKNTGDAPVIVNITWKSGWKEVKYDAVTLKKGERIRNVYTDNVSGTWEINIPSESGGVVDINVTARQYQSN